MSLPIGLPDDLLLQQVLKKSFDNIGWKVPHRVLVFLVRRIPRSFSSVAYFVELIQQSAQNSPFSLENMKTIISLMDREEEQQNEEATLHRSYGVKLSCCL